MQYVNDDMDELFRRAAKEYPLDTNSADWNKVFAALNENEPVPVKETPPRQRRGRLLWLLMLLPIALICNYYGYHSLPGNSGNQNSSQTAHDKAGEKIKSDTDPSDKSGTIQQTPKAAATQTQLATDPSGPHQNEVRPDDQTAQTKTQIAHDVAGKENQILLPGRKTRGQPALAADINKASVSKNEQWEQDINRPDIKKMAVPNRAELNRLHGIPLTGLSTNQNLSFPFIDLPAKARTLRLPPETTAGAKKPRPKIKRFYAGPIAALDATTIKFQKVEDAGYGLGLLLGYQFARRWSVEAGLLMDKKFYYSVGKYYNTSKMYLPPNSKILELDGNCEMWEIPVSVRFNLSEGRKNSWFVTAGASSYLMKNEAYDYLYYYGGSGTTAVHSKKYNTSSRHWFALAQISGGYTHRIGPAGELRIEPYLKLPLNGMGSGKLPLMSAGIQLGITKKLF